MPEYFSENMNCVSFSGGKNCEPDFAEFVSMFYIKTDLCENKTYYVPTRKGVDEPEVSSSLVLDCSYTL
jgi:hypothetical protein